MTIVPAAAALFLAACASSPQGVRGPGLSGPGAEMAAGSVGRSRNVRRKKSARINVSRLPRYRDPRAEAMLSSIVEELLKASGNSNLQQAGVSSHVAIIDSASPNAILQGNKLYVTRGMLTQVNDKAELAAVLAHEIGHILAGHARRRFEARRKAIATTIDFARNFRDPNLVRQEIAVQKRSLAAFSREQEYEADRLGLELLVKAGYQASAATRSLIAQDRRISIGYRLTGLRRKSRRSVLATHPPTPERIARVRQMVAALGKSGGPSNRAGRSEFLAAIDGMRYSGSGRTGFLRGRRFVSSRLNVAITMPPGYVALSGGSMVLGVRRGGAGAVIIFSPVKGKYAANPPTTVLRMMGRLSMSGNVDEIAGGRGALTIGKSKKGRKMRLAVIRAGTGANAAAFVVLMLERRGYSGIDRDYRAAVESVRSLNAADRQLARPWRIKVVRASGPSTLSRYIKASGGGRLAAETMLLINGLPSVKQVRPGMQLKVLELGGE